MKTSFSKTAIVFCLCAVATQAFGQTDVQALQTRAEEALVNGDPNTTADLALQMLERNADSFAGLFLLALAQADLGRQQDAAATAEQAYRAATTEDARLQAARLVASLRFGAEQYARSEFWLRRAANHAQTDEDAQAVKTEYARVAEANPLAVEFTASIAPSDNINDGSKNGVLQFEGIDLTFLLPEDQLALSGVEYAGSARVNYRVSRGDNQTTTLNGYLSGRTYTLSHSAKDLLASSPNADVRAVTGSDFATTVAEVGLTHRRRDLTSLGPTSFTLTYGKYWQGGAATIDYRDLIVEQIVPVSQNTAMSFRGSVRDQNALQPTVVDSVIYDAIGAYRMALPNNDQMQVSLALRQNDAGLETTYTEYRSTISYTFAKPLFNMRWSTLLGLGYRNYDAYTTTLDGRRDRSITLGADAVFEEVTYFGFSPRVSLMATHTDSSAEEITSSAIQVQFGIESNF